MSKLYKLKQWYPSLPIDWEEDMILGIGDRGYGNYSPCSAKYTDYYICAEIVENNPKFFKEIIEYCPYQLHYIGDKITGVTRLTDNIYFSRGLRIKRPNSDDLGFIYDFKIINNVLHIEHTFSYLMNKEGYVDHLKHLRPCIYTKEDLIK
jgi:hypothetical protein